MFQIKDFVSIAASIINHLSAVQKKVTDFNVGSVVRGMVEAPAVEVEELYQQMWSGLLESIPIAVFNSFDFDALPKKNASGLIRVEIEEAASNVMVTAGTLFVTDDSKKIRFTAIEDTIVPAGAVFCNVPVLCADAGTDGNINIGIQFEVSPQPAGFLSAAAVNGFEDGRNEEPIEERKTRFRDYIKTLNRGTVDALKYGAKTAKLFDSEGAVREEVKSVEIFEPWLEDPDEPPGLIYAYIYNGFGEASQELIAETSKIIDGYKQAGERIPGWKAAGTKVIVESSDIIATDIEGAATILPGYQVEDVLDKVRAAIGEYIADLPVGGAVIRSEIIAAAMNVEGVYNFRLVLPAGDVSIDRHEKAVVGSMEITRAPD
jgi:phage-related baseplate assembly protein